MDATPATAATTQAAPYVYAATDIRPRQAREIELCAKASSFDWLYTTTFAAGVSVSIFTNLKLKQQEEPGVRLLGPGMVGFTWGGLLSGAYLFALFELRLDGRTQTCDIRVVANQLNEIVVQGGQFARLDPVHGDREFGDEFKVTSY